MVPLSRRLIRYLVAFGASLFLMTPALAAQVSVDVDAAWPSVGPGSDGSAARARRVVMDVEDYGQLILQPQAGELDETLPLTPSVALGFEGVDGTAKDGYLHKPPDTHIAVGVGAGASGRIVMVTNSGIQIWDKTGATLSGPTPLDTFLGTSVPSAFDPKVLFDQHSDRFFIVILEGRTPNPGGTSNVHIVVSSNSVPSNLTTDWTKLSGSALTNIGGVDTWFDYPSIGADNDSLFVTGNMFSSGGSFQGAKIRVFDKSAVTGLLAGIYSFVDINVSGTSVFTVQPAHAYEATDSGNFYLINRIGSTAYRLWEISGDPGAPVIVGNAARAWAAGLQITAGAPQSGTSITLATLSSGIMNAVYRSGYIWLALSSDPDSDGKTEIFWAKLATNGGLPFGPTIVDTGYIDGSDGDEWTFMPSIATNSIEDVVIGYSQSFSDQFAEMRYASRSVGDPAGTFQTSVAAKTSVGFYDAFNADPIDRWGDYSTSVVDPDNDTAFWLANEFVKTSGIDTSIWGTFIAKTVSCGDGILDPSEQCDDGNFDPADGCSATCEIEECLDGFDNDGDGFTDFVGGDPGCAGPEDLSENDPMLPCDNGADDDGDGLADFPTDPGCSSAFPWADEDPECQDGIDNDGNGTVDFDGGLSALGYVVAASDTKCHTPLASEVPLQFLGITCGLGVELVLLLPPLIWLYRKRSPKL